MYFPSEPRINMSFQICWSQGLLARALSMASRGRSNFSARVKKYRPVPDEDFGDEGFNEDGPSLSNNKTAFDFPADDEDESLSKRFAEIEAINNFDEQMGFIHYAAGPARMGWMLNMKTVSGLSTFRNVNEQTLIPSFFLSNRHL